MKIPLSMPPRFGVSYLFTGSQAESVAQAVKAKHEAYGIFSKGPTKVDYPDSPGFSIETGSLGNTLLLQNRHEWFAILEVIQQCYPGPKSRPILNPFLDAILDGPTNREGFYIVNCSV